MRYPSRLFLLSFLVLFGVWGLSIPKAHAQAAQACLNSSGQAVPLWSASGVWQCAGSVNAGNDHEVCINPTVTITNSYGTNYVVGGLLTFPNAFKTPGSGILYGVTVNTVEVESQGWTFTPLNANPSHTTFTDAAAAPTINSADYATPRGPASVSQNSVFGTSSATSAFTEGLDPGTTSLLGILTTNAALTNQFAATTDLTVCVNILQDP